MERNWLRASGWLAVLFSWVCNCSCSCASRAICFVRERVSLCPGSGSCDTSCIKTIPNDGCSHGKIWFICKLPPPPASPFLPTLVGIFHFIATTDTRSLLLFPFFFHFLPLFHFFLARNSFLTQTYNRKNRSGTRLIREKNSVSRLNKDTNFAPFSANEKKKKRHVTVQD